MVIVYIFLYSILTKQKHNAFTILVWSSIQYPYEKKANSMNSESLDVYYKWIKKEIYIKLIWPSTYWPYKNDELDAIKKKKKERNLQHRHFGVEHVALHHAQTQTGCLYRGNWRNQSSPAFLGFQLSIKKILSLFWAFCIFKNM